MDLAENDARKLKAGVQEDHEPESIHKVTVSSTLCYRCWKTNHFPDSCVYKNSICHICH